MRELGERREGERKGKEVAEAKQDKGLESHTQKRRRCLLISGVERVEELQSASGHMGYFLCFKLGLGWTERWVHSVTFSDL